MQPALLGRLHTMQPDGDAAIRQTDTDAVLARYSAVQKQYLSDPFVRPLLPRGGHLQAARPPLINIGTYVRSEAIDQLVHQWMDLSHDEDKPCQIVSLGAGSDTRFWRIAVRVVLRCLSLCLSIEWSHSVGSVAHEPRDWRSILNLTSLRTPRARLWLLRRAKSSARCSASRKT